MPRIARPMRIALAALAALIAVVVPVAVASAAPTWLGPKTVSADSNNFVSPGDIAVLPDGTVLAAFTRTDSTPCSPCRDHVEVDIRQPGGEFGSPQMLSKAN